MPSSDRRSFVMFAVLVLLAAAPGLAQAPRDGQARELLDVEVSISGAYDSDVSLQAPSSGVGLQPPGYSLWGVGSLFYTRRSRDVVFQAAAGARVFVAGSRDGLACATAPNPLLAPICHALSFYRFVESLSTSLGEDPDAPALLRKVTETV